MSVVAAYMVPHPPLIVPKVGRGNEACVQETIDAYEKVADEIAALAPDTIIISSPHASLFTDYFAISSGKMGVGSMASFGAPAVAFKEEYDEELVKKISLISVEKEFPAGTLGEVSRELDHGVMVPLWFIRKKYTGYKLVRIGLSGLSLTAHYSFGEIINEAVEELGRKVVYIASGDLSHKLQEDGPYGFAPEGPEYDRRIMDVCSRAAFGELFDFTDLFRECAAECGHRSFVIMAGVLDGKAVEAHELSHQDVTGVGYGICTFRPTGPDERRHFLKDYFDKSRKAIDERKEMSDEYVKLARQSLENYITKGIRMAIPADVPAEMRDRRAGAFVSIHKNGKLRGCIGTILPTKDSLAEEIITNAISASTQDPRFNPIDEEELPWLDVKVDVLGDPEQIDGLDKLDVKKYGVIVTTGDRTGLLLPDLEGVDTVEEQVAIAFQKGGIKTDEEVFLYRFEVIRHT
ncbi:MAG: AmmeMemoRadiSam system protein A [Lachnospiraceae bacterium]|nr:AmmeMemoRadiSam system protein A [Lachnospiraceae bacterium]